MPLGFPCDLTVYKLLTDWGSLLAGLLALVAGVLAYVAGLRQAKATRETATAQLKSQEEAHSAEVRNIRSAVRTEIIGYTKYLIGVLSVCEGVARGETQIPRPDANTLVRSLQEPRVFPAVASRISLLRNPHLAVQFYMRIGEATALANTLALATIGRPPWASDIVPMVTRENAMAIADSLITALQLGRAIVAEAPDNESPAEAFVTSQTLNDIGGAITSAHATFPEAESFQGPDSAT